LEEMTETREKRERRERERPHGLGTNALLHKTPNLMAHDGGEEYDGKI
jgi:hypothetical protein